MLELFVKVTSLFTQLCVKLKAAKGKGFTVIVVVYVEGQGFVCAVNVTVYVPGAAYVWVGF
jgi:hypothetical protein